MLLYSVTARCTQLSEYPTSGDDVITKGSGNCTSRVSAINTDVKDIKQCTLSETVTLK